MTDMLTEIKFWTQVTGDAKRTVLCPPDLESRIKGWIDARGMGGQFAVRALRACPEDRIFLIDEGALQADLNAGVQRYRYRR